MHTPIYYAKTKKEKERQLRLKFSCAEPRSSRNGYVIWRAQLAALASATSFPFRETRGPVIYVNSNRFGTLVFVRLGGIDWNRSRFRKPLLPVIYVKKRVRLLSHDSGY
jgi:hypothetical protein